jgi:hypothetical protein
LDNSNKKPVVQVPGSVEAKGIPCSNCMVLVEISEMAYKKHFEGEELTCPGCKKVMDLWRCVERAFELSQWRWHFAALGCTWKSEQILVEVGKETTIDISKIVGDGELLGYEYIPLEGPYLISERQPTVKMFPKPKKKTIVVTVSKMQGKEAPDDAKINLVCWYATKKHLGDLATRLMLDAFEEYYVDRYSKTVVSAHTAVEILINEFLSNVLDSMGISPGKAKDFLKSRATYLPQLEVVLPMACEIRGLKKPDKKIVEALVELNTMRNKAAHEGMLREDITEKQLRNAVIGGFFGYKYFASYALAMSGETNEA